MRQGIIRRIVFNTIVLFVVSGCAPPQSVIDLGNKTADSQSITGQAHLQTLSAYKSSLTAFKTDIKLLAEAIMKQQQMTSSLIDQLRKNSIKLMVNQVIEEFDKKATPLLSESLDKKIEEIYWLPIVEKFEEYKAKETDAAKGLARSPGNEAFRKQYREYGILAEFLLRKGYENESKIRRQAYDEYIRTRQALTTEAMSIIANQRQIQGVGTESMKAQLEDVETNIDAAIASIDLASVEIETALKNEADAIGQINAFLTRPGEWELVLQGITSEINNVAGSYTSSLRETLVKKAGQPISRLSEKLSFFDLEGLVDSKINILTGKIDSKLSEFQSRTLTKSTQKEN